MTRLQWSVSGYVCCVKYTAKKLVKPHYTKPAQFEDVSGANESSHIGSSHVSTTSVCWLSATAAAVLWKITIEQLQSIIADSCGRNTFTLLLLSFLLLSTIIKTVHAAIQLWRNKKWLPQLYELSQGLLEVIFVTKNERLRAIKFHFYLMMTHSQFSSWASSSTLHDHFGTKVYRSFLL